MHKIITHLKKNKKYSCLYPYGEAGYDSNLLRYMFSI